MIDYTKPMLVFQTDFTYKEGAVCEIRRPHTGTD